MRRAASVVLLLALLVASVQADERLERSVAKGKEKIAGIWLDLAEDLLKDGHKAPAQEALAKARALAPEDEDVATLGGRIEALTEETAPDARAERAIEKARKKAAKGYDRLARLVEGDEDDPRYAAWIVKAIELDASKSRVSKLASRAKKGSLLFKSPEHPMVAWLSLPRSWKPGRTWPVLVSVEGAGCNFTGNARQFQSQRGSRDWITISPHALSCTNALDPAKYPAYEASLLSTHDGNRVAFDLAGLLAILEHATTLFGAERKIAITGFSGGGNLCYGFVFRHPDRVRAAVPACANFQPGLAQGAPQAENGGPPVHVMTGEKDPHRHLTHGKTPPGIEEQTDWAMKAFEEHGFENVKRTMLPGVGHSALPRQVWEFLDGLDDA